MYTYRKMNSYDRGAGFISTVWAMEQDSRPYGKGKTAEELVPGPGKLFWGAAEYAADCHKDVERYLEFTAEKIRTGTVNGSAHSLTFTVLFLYIK